GVLLGDQEPAMKYGFLAPLVALAVGAGLARGQEGPPPPVTPFPLGFGSPAGGPAVRAGYEYPGAHEPPLAGSSAPPAPTPETPDAPAAGADANKDGVVYVNADYLLWWVKSAPNTFPLITGGPRRSLGRLDSPDTIVLYPTEPFNNNPY